jgi:hypothetical protein
LTPPKAGLHLTDFLLLLLALILLAILLLLVAEVAVVVLMGFQMVGVVELVGI